MIRIFSQPEVKKYKTTFNSKAFLFHAACVLSVFAGPLFIVYRTHGLFINEATYREHPSVRFKYQALLLLQTSLHQGFWSTFANLNSFQQDMLLSPTFQVREIDSNMDGKYDLLQLQMDVPLADRADVHAAKLLLVFDFWLVMHSTVGMESMAIIDYTSSLPGSTLYVSGDLNLNQKQLLGYKGTDTRYSLPIIDSESLHPADFKLATIISSYQQRNLSTVLENTVYFWEPGRPAGGPFRINATIWYPTQLIAYKPGFWYALKWAWIQYMAVMLVFYFIVDRVKQFVLENHIVSCIVQRPVVDCRQSL